MTWIENLEQFCRRYNLDPEDLAEVLNDPKVIPMIRGKSFEFTVGKYLADILTSDYSIANPRLNAQIGLHDIDVSIFSQQTGKRYSAECKLASKDSFRLNPSGNPFLKVKCMRSRTLGEEAALQRSRITGIPFESLKIHNDQYTSKEFDLVITSIANAFYKTDSDGLFFWSPSPDAESFLPKLQINTQEEAFSRMYVAKSKDLAANRSNRVICTRKKCKVSSVLDCNFIPNYPVIHFDRETGFPLLPWVPLDQIETLFD